MKIAFMLMGPFEAKQDRASFGNGTAQMVGVSSMEEACSAAQKLCEDGFDCIELCGAFGETGARRIIEATGHKIPVGYVVHLPEQDALFDALFGAKV